MILSALLASALLLPVLPVLPCLTAGAEEAEDFETRKTPIMGWASWNCYRTDISEEAILSQARKLKELGLADLGYVFVNVDDGWQYGRGEDGYVRTNEKRFPSGMKYLCDTIHALGLKAGIYTDAGALTCGWCSDNQTENDDVGLWGHDESDLRRYFIDWDYDFIKVDWCGGVRAGLSTRTRYTEIGKVINKIEKEIGKDKIYNVCCWGFPGEWVVNVADSWRTGGDIFNNFGAVIEQIDNIKSLAKYTGPGHVNDLDMMQIGNGMSYEEDKSHFAMWCMMSTPLMLGNDLNSISAETLSIISNSELIALDQDPACLQATVVKNYGAVEAWAKDLGEKNSDVKAFALLNRSEKPQTLNVSFEELGLEGVTTVRDLWAHSDLSVDGRLRVTVPAHGTAVFRAAGTHKDVEAFTKTIPDTDDGSVVAADCAVSVEKKPGALNLTKTGKDDWIHTGNTVTRMKDGAGEISYGYDGSFCTYGNAAARYVWTNGEEQPRSTGDTSGIGVLGGGAYVYVSVPCDANPRTLSAAFGSYSADMRIRVIVGGKTIHEEVIPGGANRKEDRLVTATIASDVPTTAYFVADVVKSLGASDSVNLEAAALNISVKKCILGNVGIVPTEAGDLLKIPAASCVDNASIIVVDACNDLGQRDLVCRDGNDLDEVRQILKRPLFLLHFGERRKDEILSVLVIDRDLLVDAGFVAHVGQRDAVVFAEFCRDQPHLIARLAHRQDIPVFEDRCQFVEGHLDVVLRKRLVDPVKDALERHLSFDDRNGPLGAAAEYAAFRMYDAGLLLRKLRGFALFLPALGGRRRRLSGSAQVICLFPQFLVFGLHGAEFFCRRFLFRGQFFNFALQFLCRLVAFLLERRDPVVQILDRAVAFRGKFCRFLFQFLQFRFLGSVPFGADLLVLYRVAERAADLQKRDQNGVVPQKIRVDILSRCRMLGGDQIVNVLFCFAKLPYSVHIALDISSFLLRPRRYGSPEISFYRSAKPPPDSINITICCTVCQAQYRAKP